MIRARNPIIVCFYAALLTSLIYAQDLSKYREYHLGMDLPAAAEKADMEPSQVRLIHQRPAIIQELEWAPQYRKNAPIHTDPANKILFGFYNGRLYRIVVHYDRDRTEGLTEKDLIESISALYGASSTPDATITSSSASQVYGDSEKVIARWEDSQYSINLFRFSYQSTFGLLVLSKQLDALAKAAVLESVRLDDQEKPQREMERRKSEEAEKRAAEQKARPANKGGFRP